MIGLPGSGKNYYVKQYHPDVLHVSRDDIRRMFHVNYSPDNESVVVDTAKYIYEIASKKSIDIIINETFTKTITRVDMIKYLKSLGYKVHGIFLNTPVELCIERRMKDNRGCSDWGNIINNMNSTFIHPTIAEGYDDLLIHHEGI